MHLYHTTSTLALQISSLWLKKKFRTYTNNGCVVQCLQHRALNPDDPLPELSEVIARSLEPPQEVVTQCQATLQQIKDKYTLNRVEKKDQETGDKIFKDK